MTDPVDTDALRKASELARPVIENAIGWAEHEGAGPDTDEMDAVTAVLSKCAAAADELDRLRAVIENAPHDSLCNYEDTGSDVVRYPCTCWKADAL